jgi:hypothetical protein
LAEKNSLFLKKSNVRFFQKQAVFFGHRYVLDNEEATKTKKMWKFGLLKPRLFLLQEQRFKDYED